MTKKKKIRELDAASLYRHCDLESFDFQSTDDLDDLTDIIGQPRAVEAVRFGSDIQHPGYNIYAMGATGTGKRSMVLQYFNEVAKDQPVPSDWCYVINFEREDHPEALRLLPGQGVSFQKDIDELIEDVRTAFAKAFESEEYHTQRGAIEDGINRWQEQVFAALEAKARQRSLTITRTSSGLGFAPVTGDQVLSPEQFQQLPEEARTQVEQAAGELREELDRIMLQQLRMGRDLRDQVRQLDQKVADGASRGLIQHLSQQYAECPDVIGHLDALQKDIVNNVRRFLPDEPSEGDAPPAPDMVMSFLQRYKVNLIIDNRDKPGAPVVYEDHPSYQNLVGRLDYVVQMGALTTDFTLIKPGALHRANGGYLVLEAREVLAEPYAWEGLKRALQSGAIRIETPQQMDGMMSTLAPEPEPISLTVKVALLGDRALYYSLKETEPEFGELFKVAADFDEVFERSAENQFLYARLIATLARKDGLRAFERAAVARVIEHSSRLAEDSEKLTTYVRGVADLLHEADYWAGEAGHTVVTAKDVQGAIDAQIYRTSREQERMLEVTLRDMILIDTKGEQIGQVNGLSVIQLGDVAFGHPSRITARIHLGSGDVVDIDREVDLSGPFHSKGVLILTGFLGGRYAMEHPLALSASLAFEQSYLPVDGDSASSAELYALLSALGEVPVKQSLAVTGAVDQHGRVQAIGGVNEKIEGFFDLCQRRGLTGEQGVLIPASNINNLMLRRDVTAAVRAGQFHIYPVETIDQGIEILTGIPAGERNAEGNYPEKSINGRVQARLLDFAQRRAAYRAVDGTG